MRIETGCLRPGDELSIAHFRYRLEGEAANRPRSRAKPSAPTVESSA
jgi:hypothetical protein